MTDKVTKILLAAIVAGLWANAAITALKPTPAAAQAYEMPQNVGAFGPADQQMARALLAIANGTCTNQRLCGQ